MLQAGGLYPGLRPLELLRLFAAYYDDRRVARGAARPRRAARRGRHAGAPALGRPGAAPLARVRAHRPARVVFLDEPTAGMDPHARATTWELVRDLRDRGVTVLLTTHAMDEAETLCDRVAIITGGRLAALGSPAELTRHAVAATRSRSRPTPGSTSTCSPRRSASTTGDAVGGRGRASTSCAPT